MKNNIVLLLLLMGAYTAFAQVNDTLSVAHKGNTLSFGVTNQQLIDALMLTMPGWTNNPSKRLTHQSVKTYLMPPREASESASAVCYILASALEYYYNYDSNYKDNLSPDYMALSLPEVSIRNALTFLSKNGTVSAAIVPYDSKVIPTAVRATQQYRIDNYLYIFGASAKNRQKNFAVRKALMRGNPVVVDCQVPDNFANQRNTRFYTAANIKNTERHPFMVVSYDEDLEAFELLSAWGRNWGENGYLWIDYDDFGKIAKEGYVLLPRLDE